MLEQSLEHVCCNFWDECPFFIESDVGVVAQQRYAEQNWDHALLKTEGLIGQNVVEGRDGLTLQLTI